MKLIYGYTKFSFVVVLFECQNVFLGSGMRTGSGFDVSLNSQTEWCDYSFKIITLCEDQLCCMKKKQQKALLKSKYPDFPAENVSACNLRILKFSRNKNSGHAKGF